jgi:Mlc titration factor MtfA (ptsG expression regulator)
MTEQEQRITETITNLLRDYPDAFHVALNEQATESWMDDNGVFLTIAVSRRGESIDINKLAEAVAKCEELMDEYMNVIAHECKHPIFKNALIAEIKRAKTLRK